MSDLAKKVAGTFVPDELGKLTPTLAWVTKECRSGHFAPQMGKFCAEQVEALDLNRVLIESIGPDAVQGRIPCACFDHESPSTFRGEVKFTLNTATGAVTRL